MVLRKKQIRAFARLHGYLLSKTKLRWMERWDRERKQNYVFERLKTTLIRAHEGVPFYRQRFEQCDFVPRRDFHRFEDLERIPVLSKRDVRDNGDQLVDRRYVRQSVSASTSGSTGQPTTLRLNESYVALDYAYMFRHWSKAGYRFWGRYAAIRSYVPKDPRGPYWRYSFPQNTLYMSAYHLSPRNAEQYLDALIDFKPHFIRGYPSSVCVLARFAYDRRAELSGVRGVFTASETLTPIERESIERTFGKKLFDWYGMTEPAVLVTEREDHDGMEVEWGYGHPEFVGEGLERSLIATSLHNPVMPLIRYDTGDRVELATGDRGDDVHNSLYPRIRRVLGRKDECLLTKDGRVLPSLNFYSLLQDFSAIIRFQFVQLTRSKVLLNLALRTEDSEESEHLLETIRTEVMRRLGDGFELTIKVSDEFVRSDDGKTLAFVGLRQRFDS